ncbi:MAG TPA: AMP-binding protein, partial [Blastocatellia bacterium]|nr:AMP-binding protein [Blastocatellia bacterium]
MAVPTQLPPNSLRRTHGFLRFEAVAEDCQPAAILTTSPVLAAAERLSSDIECLKSVRWLRIDSAAGQHAESWGRPELNPDSVGFLQYTSGSTAMPKGVVVTHGNLLYNSAYINAGFEHSSESVGLTWLPHFHDMGLIDGIIQPLYMRFPCYLMPPLAFLQNPSKWLEAIGLYKVTHTGGPNFAYDLCVRKITAEQKKSLDLSSWSVAYNGAEPVRAETLEAFAAAFRDCGFREDAFYPAYGMAEATLKVTGGRRGRGAIFCQINTSALERDSVVEENADGTRKLVGSGQASMGTRVIIVDPVSKTKRLANRVGEVWVAGPGIAQGYWKKSQETIDTFQAHLADTGEGPFLRTGDLGFLRHGQLFVTGRLKDLIIVRGLNHYPQDIELTVQKSHPALRPGGGAVFSVERTSGEQLVILQEVDGRKLGNFETVIDTIRQAVTDEHEISPYAVVLVKTGAIPKTTSGKTQRRAAREMYESGAIEIVAEWIGRETAEAQTEMPAFPELPLTPTVITAWLKSFLAVTLGLDCSSIEAGAPLVRYGLDSLHAVELIHRIERASGDVLSIPDILGNSTLDDVAAKLVNQGSSREQLIQPSLSISRDSSGPCPLSYGQHSLWFLQKIAPESAAYNIAAGVRILSEVDVDALRKSFQILAARHDSLRASFTVVDGVPQQTASDEHTVDFVLRDVSGSDERELNDL